MFAYLFAIDYFWYFLKSECAFLIIHLFFAAESDDDFYAEIYEDDECLAAGK